MHGFDLNAKISFSQSGEDLIVRLLFSWIHIERPTYADLGANDPFVHSNTALMYLDGCSGVCIEPNAWAFERFKAARPRDTVLHAGVGAGDAASAPFFVMSAHDLGTFSRPDAERMAAIPGYSIIKVIETPLISLHTVIEQYFAGRRPDFVSLDIEGMDMTILQSLDFNRHRPPVFCIETVAFGAQKNSDIVSFMTAKNYLVFADTYINTIFVDKGAWDGR